MPIEDELRLKELYQPKSVEELLTPETVRKLLLGFTAGLDWMGTALEEADGSRHDLWGNPDKYWCKFCKHFRREIGKEQLCVAWDRKVAQVLLEQMSEDYPGQREEFGKVYHCHAGMLDFAEVIHLVSRPFAVLHGGQLVPKDDVSWLEQVDEKLKKPEFGLDTEQIKTLIDEALGDGPWLVDPQQLENRVEQFRSFARELETLLEKLYRERRHATEETLLHQLASRMMPLDSPTWETLWEMLTELFGELQNASGITQIDWFMGSERDRFRLGCTTKATPAWRGRALSVGPLWEELSRYGGATEGHRWDSKMKKELGLTAGYSCFIYPLVCTFGVPSRSIPSCLVLACKTDDAVVLKPFLTRLAVEIQRAVLAVIGEIERARITQHTAAQGAYVGHDIKMPLQVLVYMMPAIRMRMQQLSVTDPDLLSYLSTAEKAVNSAQDKATQLEQMPVREFVIEPRKKSQDLVAMLDKVVDLAKGLGKQHNVGVNWVLRPESSLYCEVDSRRMLVAVHAVLDNAVKFSFRGNAVEVFLRSVDQKKIELTVSNIGVGIRPEKKIAIFEFGKRGEVQDKRGGERPGSGLGLPFAKRIIEAHGGSIDISSRSTLKPPPDPDDYLSHRVDVTIRLPLTRNK